MDDTNKTLALLLVAAIVVSLGGTIVSLNKLGQIELPGITGKVTDGKANVTITATYIVNLTDTLVWFGVGSLNSSAGATSCALYSSSANNRTPSDCGNWTFSKDYFKLENIGSTNINVTITGTTASTLLGGGEYKYQCADTEGEAGTESYPNGATSWTDMTAVAQPCISNLDEAAANDEAGVFIMVNITEGLAGAKSQTVTFTASVV